MSERHSTAGVTPTSQNHFLSPTSCIRSDRSYRACPTSRMRKKAEDVAGYWGTIGRACEMLGVIDAWWGPEHGGAVQLRELRGAGGQGPPAAGDPRDHQCCVGGAVAGV